MYSAMSEGLGRVMAVECQRGDRLLDVIRESMAAHQMENAVILSGVATFDRLHYHYVASGALPPVEHHVHECGAFEVANISGLVLRGEPHIHFTAHDLNTGRTVAAHLEPDTTVLYVAEIVMAEIKGLPDFERVSYPNKIVIQD